MSGPVRVGDIFWPVIRGERTDGPHPAVVTRLEGDWAEVVYGQTIQATEDDLVIAETTTLGMRFGLTHPTFFRAGNAVLIHVDDLGKAISFCHPPSMLCKFQKIASDAKREGALKHQQRHQVIQADSRSETET